MRSEPAPDASTGPPSPRAGRRLAFVAVSVMAVWLFLTWRLYGRLVLTTPFGRTYAVTDDVYVSACFARTFAQGEGLLWYPGAPHVEGFSNPLWVLLLAALHRLPGCGDDTLGLYVLVVELATLAATAVLVVLGAARLCSLAGARAGDAPAARMVAFVACAVGAMSLCHWASCGFEVTLVAALAAGALVEALRPSGPRPALLGLLLGLSFWTRMDAWLTCSGALVVTALRWREQRPAHALRTVGMIAGAMVAALLLARRAYYGDWVPNTYHLKATGWALLPRLAQGLAQNWLTLVQLVTALAPLAWLARRGNGAVRAAVSACCLPVLLQVAYGTYLGGDFSFEAFGYDRFGATALPCLLIGVGAMLLLPAGALFPDAGGPVRRAVPLALAMAVAVSPTAPLGGAAIVARALFDFRSGPFPEDDMMQKWVNQGKLLEQATHPGAKIAVCAAGALVYFSHRGGVDLLGKVDPYVAHLPATATPPRNARCWRGSPGAGHNKEDIAGTFARRRPDVSVVEPPPGEATEWVAFHLRKLRFHARRDSPLVRWEAFKRPRGR